MLNELLLDRRTGHVDGNSAGILARVRPGDLVIGQPGSIIRASLISVPRVTYRMEGATILGSEALPVASATLVSGAIYKIATSLHSPNPGGSTPAVYLYQNGVGYDGTTPAVLTRNSTNSASLSAAGTWALTGGFFYFWLADSSAPTADTVFEIPQRSCVAIDDPGMRLIGGNIRHFEGYGVGIGVNRVVSGFEMSGVDLAWGTSDAVNVKANAGACTGIILRDSAAHDVQYDGAGGGDGISIEQPAAGSLGNQVDIRRFNLARCAKSGISNTEGAIVTYHDLLLDNCPVAITGGGAYAGSHTWSRIKMINGLPASSPATGVHGFYIFSGCSGSTVVSIDGLSMYAGTNALSGLRAFRAQSAAVTIVNSVIDSHGATKPFDAAFFTSGTSGTVTENHNAAGGSTSSNWFSFTPDATDITTAATPYNDAANGDLSPNSLIIGKGVGGVDIGYTSTPA